MAVSGVSKVNIGVGCDSTLEYYNVDEAGVIQQPRFTYKLSNPLAEFITLHFTKFNLPANDYVLIRASDANDKEVNKYRYRGDDVQGEFFSSALYTRSVVIELYTTGDTTPVNPFECIGFKIDDYRYLAVGTGNSNSQDEEVCGADDSREASCFRAFTTAFSRADAVIRLLIHKPQGSFFCTGWLVGCEGHVLTNHHCISQQIHASNTEYEFRAQGATCSQSCNVPLGCRGTVRARSARLVTVSQELDYALVKLDPKLASEYGYLTLRPSGPVLNERIYIPQHPSGWGKRIAMKSEDSYGKVESLTMGGCAVDQVAYYLDTLGGSSGSPVIAWSDNAVVALHHCGGCPNTAINIRKIVNDLRSKGALPQCALSTDQPTNSPVTTAPPTQRPTKKTVLDGTLFSTSTSTSVDYIDFELDTDANVELDILSMEATSDERYADVNGDCNAGYIDSSLVLFRLVNNAISMNTVIATNNDAPAGYGNKDGSISQSDSYMYLPLSKGRYRLAIGVATLTTEQAIADVSPISTSPRVCDTKISNYGSYRLTITANAGVTATSPNSYIGNQCSAQNTVRPYSKCSYHTEPDLTRKVSFDGTIVRNTASVSVDYIPFSVDTFGRLTIEISSYETQDGFTFVDVNGDCESAYIDAVAYLFSRSGGTASAPRITSGDLITVGDEDENIVFRKNRRSFSFRDPYLALSLPRGNYVIAVGRYPFSVTDAINKVSTASVSRFTPESCGKPSNTGNYMVTINSARDLRASSPGSFQGRKCPANMGNIVCTVTA
jgi:hypothetical protein